MALITCKECGKELSDKAPACPNCGAPYGGSGQKPATKVGKILPIGCLGFVVILIIGIAASHTNQSAPETTYATSPIVAPEQPIAQDQAPPLTESTPRLAPRPLVPATEAGYISLVHDVTSRYDAAENDLKRSSVYAQFLRLIPQAVPGMWAENWIGKITTLSTNGDGNAVVEIQLFDSITVSTWNNSFSDIEDNTLIRNGTPLYMQLSTLAEGQIVVFSAHLLKLKDITEKGKVEEPDMLARFSDIRPIGR